MPRTKTSSKTSAYAEKINRVCQYIYAHLDQDLSVEQLSQLADFSKFHFHRQFFEYTGINVFRFVQMLRLKQASYQLAFNRHYPIIEIALDAKFENPESFSRAFKQAFGQTPSQFRRKPDWQNWNEKYQFPQRKLDPHMEVTLIDFKTTQVAVLEHHGPPEKVNDSALSFIEWRKASGLSPVKSSQTFGIAYSDPATTEPEAFRFDICGSTDQDIPENPQGVIPKQIPGGRCAKLRHLGSLDHLSVSIHALYGDWLPGSGETLRDFPCFVEYLNFFPEVAEHELITDIYLPLNA